ncbi:MAG: hypothetical protein M1814_005760 [Vezdaea aestivalis]|nr:MAG: hypothetical protein M1814_005760 [Vezdaea aestivalis]
MRFSTIVAGMALTASTLTAAAPSPNSLFARTCPRYDVEVAKDVASLYLGRGNNKSNQVERLIEEILGYLVGQYPKCDKAHLYLDCGPRKTKEKRTDEPQCRQFPALQAMATDTDKSLADKYPYDRDCKIKCKTYSC